jgi:hypothetical protein
MCWEDDHEQTWTSCLDLGEGDQCKLADSNLKLDWGYQTILWASQDRTVCNVTGTQIMYHLNRSLQCNVTDTQQWSWQCQAKVITHWGTNLLQVQWSGTANQRCNLAIFYSERIWSPVSKWNKRCTRQTDNRNRNWGNVQWKPDPAVTSSHFETADWPWKHLITSLYTHTLSAFQCF